MGEKINAFEPFIAVTNSVMLDILMPLTFIILISEFPIINADIVFVLPRIKRRGWLCAQLCELAAFTITFILFIMIGTIVPATGRNFFGRDWSRVITDFTKVHPEFSGNMGTNLLMPNLYYQYSITAAAVYSLCSCCAYMMIIGLGILYSSICGKRALGFVGTGAVIFLGTATCFLNTKFKWLFPMAHSLLWLHNERYVRKTVFPVWVSALYMILLICGLIFACFRRIERMDFTG